ncbi:hypothetical protein NLI96_g8664 [Meripilus lineatus]|uniref:Serine protease n=1 Tax=Meripilus lineatus TaxID=2056292 RepID=A0AAD5YG31_9APHY|nr:hypothetical protein NLI96_g8664 [Physisporinus lineatus]
MRFSAILATTVALLVSPILGSPTIALVDIDKYNGKIKQGSYIVTLKSDVSKTAYLNWLSQHIGTDNVTHTEWNPAVLNGFAGTFSTDTLNLLRSSPDVKSISEDGIMSIRTIQTDAPWGLARLSTDAKLTNQDANALTFTYKFNSAAGSGVDIYIIDTGIFLGHSDFGGRAKWGATFGGYPDEDGNGHGTHVSGTAAGNQFGVAKSASLIAVKVLDDDGSGFVSDIISGLDFVMTSVQSSGRPSVASMSLGGGAFTPLDNAVESLTNAGIHVTVAAGNDHADAGDTSPARVPSAITVAAMDISDSAAGFSNFGAVVDLYAPGVNIISAGIEDPDSIAIFDGTSQVRLSGFDESRSHVELITPLLCDIQATPHVAGLVAYFISVNGNKSPAAMSTFLQTISVKGALSGIPDGTVNDLARNDQ